MIQLSTIHPRTSGTTIIARPPLGECRYPRVVSGCGCGCGCIIGHSFARLVLSKMLLKAWHTCGSMITDTNRHRSLNTVEFEPRTLDPPALTIAYSRDLSSTPFHFPPHLYSWTYSCQVLVSLVRSCGGTYNDILFSHIPTARAHILKLLLVLMAASIIHYTSIRRHALHGV